MLKVSRPTCSIMIWNNVDTNRFLILKCWLLKWNPNRNTSWNELSLEIQQNFCRFMLNSIFDLTFWIADTLCCSNKDIWCRLNMFDFLEKYWILWICNFVNCVPQNFKIGLQWKLAILNGPICLLGIYSLFHSENLEFFRLCFPQIFVFLLYNFSFAHRIYVCSAMILGNEFISIIYLSSMSYYTNIGRLGPLGAFGTKSLAQIFE